MNVAWIGCGKLGTPCALALAAVGHRVVGYDTDPMVVAALESGVWPHEEPGVNELLAKVGYRFVVMQELPWALSGADVVVIAVQTPHGPGYGGETPTQEVLAPFDTSYLADAVSDVCADLDRADNPAPIVVVSTVLPGTCRDELEPLAEHRRPIVYSPQFVAMGSVLADLAAPEFVLAGVRRPEHAGIVRALYLHVDAPLLVTSIESAELAKVAYNCIIGTKIAVANALGEMADAVGADVDEVTGVLAAATDRVISARYLSAGMGDGGPCHGRDNQAMSWLAEQVGLSADPFGFAMRARDAQAERLASIVVAHAVAHGLPVVVCGRAYKPGVRIEAGSAALLVGHYIEAAGHPVTWLTAPGVVVEEAAVFLVALPDHAPAVFPAGSVVVDPWGTAEVDATVMLVRPGRP